MGLIVFFILNYLMQNYTLFSPINRRKKLGNSLFLRDRQKVLTRGSIKYCDRKIFHSYASFHRMEKNSGEGKFLIYHILDEDPVGLGCRLSAALYALTLAMHTRRILILSGVEFKYI